MKNRDDLAIRLFELWYRNFEPGIVAVDTVQTIQRAAVATRIAADTILKEIEK